jgi:hypothetical protein
MVWAHVFLLRFRAVAHLEAFKIKIREFTVAVGLATRWVARKAVSAAVWHVPHYSRWGLYPQAVFVVIALIWFEYRPEWATQGPGVAMGFLAVAAIYMAVRGPDSTRIEGVVWIVISFCLFAGEMRFIRLERKAHDAEQAELRNTEERRERDQAQSFAQLIGKGAALFNALVDEKALTAKNLTLTAENLEHITGGDEYCWLVPMTPLPVGLGGDPAYQGNNWWQLAVKNSGKVVLPTCDLRFMPFPTDKELREGASPSPPFLFYHFDKVAVMGRSYSRTTNYFIKGDRIYSGVIETPTHSFIEVIKFEPDPKDPARYVPKCLVAAPAGKTLENDCYPQSTPPQSSAPVKRLRHK